jgi:hypothetical protein
VPKDRLRKSGILFFSSHWSLDVTFREDASRARDRTLAENLSWIRRFTLGLLKQHPDTKTSLIMKRRKCGWSTDFLAEVLFGKGGECAPALTGGPPAREAGQASGRARINGMTCAVRRGQPLVV